MTISERLKSDLASAMKAGERSRVEALRFVLSELQRAAKDGGGDEVAVLRRERKRRLDAARQFREAGRDELAASEEAEAELIDGYLPAELPDAELDQIVAAAIAQTGATSVKEMGKVMGVAIGAAGGRADGARVSARVKAALQQ